MDFTSILSQMIKLFIVVIVGYCANRCRVMSEDFNKQLTSLVLNITTPCMTVASVLTSEHWFSPGQIGYVMLVAVLSYLLSVAFALVIPRLLRTPKSSRGVYEFMIVFGNVGFIGFPVSQAIFGSDGLFYAALFNMPFSILVYTMGVVLISGKGERAKFDWHVLISPCMVASVLTLLLALFHVQLPALVGETVDFIGQITTPTALLIIGSNMAKLPLRGILGGPRVWVMAAVRLLLAPAALLLLLRGWVSDPTILGVAIVIQGMPVAANCTMLALQYGGDSETAAQGTFLTTLLSVVTIPLLAMMV